MLTHFSIKNFGLIEQAALDLSGDFSVVTGETGAGKSMFIDALAFCLGDKANERLIGAYSDEAMVEATFEISNNSPLLPLLAEQDIPLEDGDLILRRTMVKGGKSKAFAGGFRITQATLNTLAEHLADIHGQHDQQILLRPARHANLLDQFGGYSPITTAVRQAHTTWRSLQTELAEAKSRIDNREREETLLTAYVEELDQLAYTQGEEIQLAEERKRLMGAEHVAAAVAEVQALLEQDGGAVELLGRAEKSLSDAATKAGEDVAALAQRLWTVYNEAHDISREVARLADTEADPARLQAVDDRLAALADCARKHKVEVHELTEIHQQLSEKLNNLNNLSENIEKLEQQEKAAFQNLKNAAKKLTEARQTTAENLSQKVENLLADLKMPGCRFAAKLIAHEDGIPTANGAEKVTFVVSTNPAQKELLPLVDVASGGEVSRLMLALKAIFYANLPPMLLVFDEVDTGIGGAVADAVGQAMVKLAHQHQVIAITHQPQVAARGACHVQIQKTNTAQSTRTHVTQLAKDARRDEIARMLSGAQITDAARAAADSLLNT